MRKANYTRNNGIPGGLGFARAKFKADNIYSTLPAQYKETLDRLMLAAENHNLKIISSDLNMWKLEWESRVPNTRTTLEGLSTCLILVPRYRAVITPTTPTVITRPFFPILEMKNRRVKCGTEVKKSV